MIAGLLETEFAWRSVRLAVRRRSFGLAKIGYDKRAVVWCSALHRIPTCGESVRIATAECISLGAARGCVLWWWLGCHSCWSNGHLTRSSCVCRALHVVARCSWLAVLVGDVNSQAAGTEVLDVKSG